MKVDGRIPYGMFFAERRGRFMTIRRAKSLATCITDIRKTLGS